MEIIKGTAKRVRNASEVSGGGRNSHVTTSHISMFLLDKQQVQIKSTEPFMIDEDDLVYVAGKIKSGLFKGYAYKNTTTGVSGDSGILVMFLFSLVFPGIGISILISFSDPFFGLFPKVLGSIFIGVGLYMFYQATLVLKATNLLRSCEYP